MKKFLIIKNSILCKLYEINWREQFILIGCLLLFWPVGLYQMWKNRHWNVVVKSIITAFFMISMLLLVLSQG